MRLRQLRESSKFILLFFPVIYMNLEYDMLAFFINCWHNYVIVV